MERVRAYVRREELLKTGDRVLLGFSGGADSVFLLLALSGLLEKGENLRAVHIHHGLRGAEADRDAAFCLEFCQKRGILCRVVYLDAAAEAKETGTSVEEAGRNARYRVFREEAERWEREMRCAGRETEGRILIATAHHAGDSAETFLENLFRGTGLPGLSGIPPARGNIIRPLLSVSGQEIRVWLRERDISWVEDSTNAETEYTRNRIRNRLLPEIEREINPRAAEHIAEAAQRIAAADRYLKDEAGKWLSGREEKTGSKGEASLPAGEFLAAPEALKSYIFREILTEAGIPLRDVGAVHLEAVLRLAGGQSGRMCSLPGGGTARKVYDRLVFCPGEENREKTGEKEEQPAGTISLEIIPVGPGEAPVNFPDEMYTKWMDYDKIKGALCLRTRREGDFYFLESGGRKTLKTYFTDEKIPAGERDRIPLVADGSHVLWIVGGRISAAVRVTENTRRILRVTYEKGAEDGR